MSNFIDNEFFNSFVYSVFKAIGEKLGDESWKIVWRTGEILFDEIKEKIEFENKEPVEIVSSIANYLKKKGYFTDAKIIPLNDKEFEYWMKEPAIEKGAFKLIEEGCAPPHISTSLLFSALRNLANSELELIGKPEKREDWVIERWKLKIQNCKINLNPVAEPFRVQKT